MHRPDCWPEGQPCPNPCARAHYNRTVLNQHHLTAGGWEGWRFAGAELVDPEGSRIRPERLRGLLWRQEAEARRDHARARRKARTGQQLVKVLTVELDEWRRQGRGAG